MNCPWTQKNEKFSIRQKLFDESVGTLVYRSIHCCIFVSYIISKLKITGAKSDVSKEMSSLSIPKLHSRICNVFEGSFDVDIWKEVWKIAEVLYGKSTAKRPTRRDPL